MMNHLIAAVLLTSAASLVPALAQEAAPVKATSESQPNGIASPPLSATSDKAYSRTAEGLLVVGTGTIERRWKPTAHGLVTVSVKNTGATPREWATGPAAFTADWSNPAILTETAACELVSLTATDDDDEGFTNRNLKVTAVLSDPAQKVTLRHEIRATPANP